mmetsp:Transcript_6228/g.15144  ORF Transcript_6228/g.15144 Transcript_6228/m.15144 type:complete len:452 (+) Transcript_6228:752-2107(+)
MHVVRHLPPPLGLLLLRRLVEALVLDPLREEFLQPRDPTARRVWRRVELLEAGMRLRGHTQTERAHTELGHGPVEQNLHGDIQHRHRLLKMAHQQHVSRLEELVHQRQMIDMAQHCLALRLLLAVPVHQHGQILQRTVFDIRGNRQLRLPCVFVLRNRHPLHRNRRQTLIQLVRLVVQVHDATGCNTRRLGQILDDILVILLDVRRKQHQRSLVLQAVHILGRIRINLLPRLVQLVVEALDQRGEVTADNVLPLRVAFVVGVVIFEGLGVVGEADLRVVGLGDREDAGNVGDGGAPEFLRNLGEGGGDDVELGRDEVEEGGDLLAGDGGGIGEDFEAFHLLLAVRSFSAALRQDLLDAEVDELFVELLRLQTHEQRLLGHVDLLLLLFLFLIGFLVLLLGLLLRSGLLLLDDLLFGLLHPLVRGRGRLVDDEARFAVRVAGALAAALGGSP